MYPGTEARAYAHELYRLSYPIGRDKDINLITTTIMMAFSI